MYTTLNKIKSSSPCDKGWRTLLKGLGKVEADDEPLHLLDILRINGLYDARWSIRAFSVKERQLFAIGSARQVQHLWVYSEHLLNMTEAFVLQTPVNGVNPPSLLELKNHLSAVTEVAVAKAVAEAAKAAAEGVTGTETSAAEAASWAEAAAWAAAGEAWAAAGETWAATVLSRESVVKAACSYVESRIG